MSTQNRLLTKQQAAELLSISPRTLDRLRSQGLIESVKIGTRVMFQHEAVAAFVARSTSSNVCDGLIEELAEELDQLLGVLECLDINTTDSCWICPHGVVGLEFETVVDAKEFLDCLAVEAKPTGSVPGQEPLDERMTGCGSEGDWQYDVRVRNWGVEDAVRLGRPCPPAFDFQVTVRFHRSDLPLVLERLRRASAAAA